jgi:PAS domain-containing protein
MSRWRNPNEPIPGVAVGAPPAVVIVDEQWRVERVNSGMRALIGSAVDDWYDAGVVARIHAHDLEGFVAALTGTQASGNDANVAVRLIDSQGRWLPCKVRVTALEPDAGFVLIITPVSCDALAVMWPDDITARLARAARRMLVAAPADDAIRLP